MSKEAKVKPEVLQAIKQTAEISELPSDVKAMLLDSCKEVDGYKVYNTTNYDIFKRLLGNRDTTCVKKIIESIQKIGYVDNPLIVNENLEIIDGQNRLEAFKTLNLTVPFHIVYGIGINEARQMNIGRGNWKPLDWVKSYAETGNESYKKLLEFYEFTHFDAPLLVQLSRRLVSSKGISTKIFSSGTYEMTTEEKNTLSGILPWVIKMKPYLDAMSGSKRLSYMAFAYIYNVEGVDRKRVEKIIEKDYFNITPYPDVETYLKEISRIYNKGLKTKGTFRFDYIYMSNGVVTNE